MTCTNPIPIPNLYPNPIPNPIPDTKPNPNSNPNPNLTLTLTRRNCLAFSSLAIVCLCHYLVKFFLPSRVILYNLILYGLVLCFLL